MRIGVADIGGTYIKTGVFENGQLLSRMETPCRKELGAETLMAEVIRALEKHLPFQRVGISTSGQVNPKTGSIKYANDSFPGYTGTAVRDLLEEHFRLPTVVENDVNAAAVGEAFFGSGLSITDRSFLMLTYGTGIGGAIFQEGKIFYGSDYSAGEVGYLITHGEKIHSPDQLMDGVYQTWASTTALVSNAVSLDPALHNGRTITAHLDRPEVRRLVDQWIHEVLLGLASLIYTLNPSHIILGGGIMVDSYIIKQIRQRLPGYLLAGHRNVDILPAKLGNNAGMIGAGYLAEHLRTQDCFTKASTD